MNMGSSPIFRRNEGRPEIIENRLVNKVSGLCFALKILAKLIKISNFNIIFSNHLVIILEDGLISHTPFQFDII